MSGSATGSASCRVLTVSDGPSVSVKQRNTDDARYDGVRTSTDAGTVPVWAPQHTARCSQSYQGDVL